MDKEEHTMDNPDKDNDTTFPCAGISRDEFIRNLIERNYRKVSSHSNPYVAHVEPTLGGNFSGLKEMPGITFVIF